MAAMTHPILDRFYCNNHQYGAVYLGSTVLHSDYKHTSHSPIDNEIIAHVSEAESDHIPEVVEASRHAFLSWRQQPAPRRGELVRCFANHVRENKEALAQLITLECGKPWQESLGEVQELIDICDFAVGLSRQLYGLTMTTERTEHRMMEQWHSLGPVLIITAFNFPVAVWGWNAVLALICGNSIIWKPSLQTPLCAIACHRLLLDIIEEQEAPQHLSVVVNGGKTVVEELCEQRKIPLVSATGSCLMGKHVGTIVANRLGKCLLELGGNNAMIITASANIDLAVRAVIFSAFGTSGQRCTTLRRLIVEESILPDVMSRIQKALDSIKIGNPFEESNLMGPIISLHALKVMEDSLVSAQNQGGVLICGGDRINDGVPNNGFYVTPAVVVLDPGAPIVQRETFAPILFVHSYVDFKQAIEIQNSVNQGLSSAIFTNDIIEAEYFMSVRGSDCGIANVNIGTSGAEIGGAFGGEKDTGGGRESGSDAWKNYMRRSTNTINYGVDLPLAQGISFKL